MDESPLVLRMVNVVPKLVEQSAAPALKACSGVAEARGSRLKDSAIGMAMPVKATIVARTALAFKAENLVCSPPARYQQQ